MCHLINRTSVYCSSAVIIDHSTEYQGHIQLVQKTSTRFRYEDEGHKSCYFCVFVLKMDEYYFNCN